MSLSKGNSRYRSRKTRWRTARTFGIALESPWSQPERRSRNLMEPYPPFASHVATNPSVLSRNRQGAREKGAVALPRSISASVCSSPCKPPPLRFDRVGNRSSPRALRDSIQNPSTGSYAVGLMQGISPPFSPIPVPIRPAHDALGTARGGTPPRHLESVETPPRGGDYRQPFKMAATPISQRR